MSFSAMFSTGDWGEVPVEGMKFFRFFSQLSLTFLINTHFSQHDCETLPAAALPEPETICDFETDLCGWTAQASPGGLNFYRTSGAEVAPGRGVVLGRSFNRSSINLNIK